MKKKLNPKKLICKQYKKKNNTSTKLFLVLVFLCSILITNSKSLSSYSIEPAIEEFVMGIYEQKTSTIRFTNTTEEKQNFKIYSDRYNPERERILDERNFITFDIKEFSLDPGENIEIEYNIDIPSDTLAGSYFSIIVIENIHNQKPTASSYIGINYGIGSLIAIHVEDETDITEIFLEQVDIELKYKKPLNPFNTEIEYTVKNNSKYTFLTTGQLMLISPNKQPIFYQINPNETKLYPDNELTFEFQYEGDLKDFLTNKTLVAKINSQFSNNLRETQIELPYYTQTLTITIAALTVIIILTIYVIISKKKGDRKIAKIFKRKFKKK